MNKGSSHLEIKAKMFRGFADPTRLSILETMRGGERTVGTIAELVEQSQPNVSNHLSCLKDCGLVSSRREGKNVYYSIASERIKCLLKDGDAVVKEAGEKIVQCAHGETVVQQGGEVR